jgi:hypothetical protein
LVNFWRWRAAGACAIGVLLLSAASLVQAQTLDDPIERARIQVGPIGLTPSIALTSVGIDSNVFNEFEDPRSDFRFAVAPQIDAWLRAGRSRLSVSARSDLWYFHRYSSERSADGALSTRFEVRGARVTPWLTGGLMAGRRRIGYEIDLRYRGTTRRIGGGADVRVAGRTRVGASVERVTYDHEPADFLGSNLREVLDRRTDSVGAQLRYSLTPLTTFVVSGERARERFEFTPSRNANSSRIEAGFDLSSFALIGGRGRIGYRRFTGIGGDLPPYSGVVASVAASSVIRGRTHLEVAMERDVNYSLEMFYPYYVLTGATVTVTPQLTPRWDVRGRAGRYGLGYRAAVGLSTVTPDRVDRFRVIGAGIGYRLSRDIRVGIDVDRERRQSPVRQRAYEGFRTGLSVSYGR